jgi:hypothetical protein
MATVNLAGCDMARMRRAAENMVTRDVDAHFLPHAFAYQVRPKFRAVALVEAANLNQPKLGSTQL